MDRTLISETTKSVDEVVLLNGWVTTIRDHGKLTFFDSKDRSGVIQCIGSNLPKMSPMSAVSVTGKIAKRPEKLVNEKLATGKVELQVEKVEILSVARELPFDMGKEDLGLSLPTLLDFRTLSLRNHKVSNIFKVQEAIMEGFRIA